MEDVRRGLREGPASLDSNCTFSISRRPARLFASIPVVMSSVVDWYTDGRVDALFGWSVAQGKDI
jgi:hypothetical protein